MKTNTPAMMASTPPKSVIHTPMPALVLVWWLLLPDTDTDTSAGMGVWMTLLGGVLAIVAGVLVFMDQE